MATQLTAPTDRGPRNTLQHILNLPNGLTLARLFLAFALFACIARELWLLGLVIFAVAAVTDWLDGYFARMMGLTGAFGRNFDPLVDKVLICGAFVYLIPVAQAGVAPWMVTVVVGRELAVTSLRSYLETHTVKFGADWLGKLKMGLQCAAIIAALALLAMPMLRLAWLDATYLVLLWTTVIVTALSGAQYCWKAFNAWTQMATTP